MDNFKMKIQYAIILPLLFLNLASYSQDWEKKNIGNIYFEFPEPNTIQEAINGQALTYNSGRVFITATTVIDSLENPPVTNLEYSRYYTTRLNNILLRLKGKLREATDTTIADIPMHYSSTEITMPDTVMMRYDILQMFRNDTLYGFSCQYVMEDPAGIKMRDRFYSSLNFGKQNRGRSIDITHLTIVGAALAIIVVLGIAYFMIRYRSRQRRQRHTR